MATKMSRRCNREADRFTFSEFKAFSVFMAIIAALTYFVMPRLLAYTDPGADPSRDLERISWLLLTIGAIFGTIFVIVFTTTITAFVSKLPGMQKIFAFLSFMPCLYIAGYAVGGLFMTFCVLAMLSIELVASLASGLYSIIIYLGKYAYLPFAAGTWVFSTTDRIAGAMAIITLVAVVFGYRYVKIAFDQQTNNPSGRRK